MSLREMDSYATSRRSKLSSTTRKLCLILPLLTNDRANSTYNFSCTDAARPTILWADILAWSAKNCPRAGQVAMVVAQESAWNDSDLINRRFNPRTRDGNEHLILSCPLRLVRNNADRRVGRATVRSYSRDSRCWVFIC